MRCCLRSILSAVGTLLVLAALAAGAFYLYALPRLDRVLADAVRREYMLPPSAKVEIKHGAPLDAWRGKVDSFRVHSPEAKLEGLRIQDVDLAGSGIQFDLVGTALTGHARLRQVDHAKLRFRVSEQALQDRWADDLSQRGISDVNVDLKGEQISVSGKANLMLTQVPVSARGVFVVDGSQRIRMQVNEVNLAGTKLELGQFKNLFSQTIKTPVLDLGEFKMGVKVTRLEPRNGFLLVEAESEGMDDLAAAMQQAKPAQHADKAAEKKDTATELKQKAGEAMEGFGKDIENLGGKLKKAIK